MGLLLTGVEAGLTVSANAPTPEAPSMVKAVDLYLTKVANGERIDPVEWVTDEEKEAFIRTQQSKLAKRSRTRRTASAK